MAAPKTSKAVVLLSGGQDSTTCLYWAKHHFEHVRAVIFAYGQRHEVEVTQAKKIAALAGVPYRVLTISTFTELGGSSLIDSKMLIPQASDSAEGELPNTFLPGRNLVFLSYAAAYALQYNIAELVGGMCETDYSGYPDCRQAFTDSAARTISLALDRSFTIHTPLMQLDKAAVWQLAAELGCLDVVIEDSHTCYSGDHTTYHDWGYGCDACPACALRKRGYLQAFKQKQQG